VTVLAGFCGWLFSKTMIAHEFSPWVDRTATDIYDALGNYSSTNVTTETVWVTVILTVVLFAIVGMMLAYTVVSDLREKEG
jgi:hypothetical protein